MSFPRVCIVGAGSLSTRRIYPNIGAAGAVIAGVCDLDLAKATANAQRWGGTVYTDMAAMLDAERPDGVIVCIGPEQHAQLAPLVLARGIPCYTEKPPAPNAAGALAVARAAQAANTWCMTAFKKRYTTAYTRARAFIDSFPADDLYAIAVHVASAQYSNDSARRSFILDFCVHVIDLIGFLGGDVASVFAFSKGPDAYAVSLRFANGAVGTLSLNDGRSFAIPSEEVEISLRGGNFMTVHNSATWKLGQTGKCTEWREPPTFTSSGDSGHDTGHLAELEAFVTGLREGRPETRSSSYESYKTMLLMEAIIASAASGTPVTLHYETL